MLNQGEQAMFQCLLSVGGTLSSEYVPSGNLRKSVLKVLSLT